MCTELTAGFRDAQTNRYTRSFPSAPAIHSHTHSPYALHFSYSYHVFVITCSVQGNCFGLELLVFNFITDVSS